MVVAAAAVSLVFVRAAECRSAATRCIGVCDRTELGLTGAKSFIGMDSPGFCAEWSLSRAGMILDSPTFTQRPCLSIYNIVYTTNSALRFLGRGGIGGGCPLARGGGLSDDFCNLRFNAEISHGV